MSRVLLAIGGALVALTMSIGTAAAAAPSTVEVSFHSSNPNFLPCPGFHVDAEIDVSRRITTFVDGAGTPIRVVAHVTGTGTLTDPLTGISLPDESHFTVTTDLLAGTRTFSGNVRVDTAPGAGVVFKAVGHLVFGPDGSVLFEAGPHDDLDGNLGALCAYLGGS
jgi:hypothetical protein